MHQQGHGRHCCLLARDPGYAKGGGTGVLAAYECHGRAKVWSCRPERKKLMQALRHSEVGFRRGAPGLCLVG
jgi:hypothetical protein